jgi:hypothetical protein
LIKVINEVVSEITNEIISEVEGLNFDVYKCFREALTQKARVLMVVLKYPLVLLPKRHYI